MVLRALLLAGASLLLMSVDLPTSGPKPEPKPAEASDQTEPPATPEPDPAAAAPETTEDGQATVPAQADIPVPQDKPDDETAPAPDAAAPAPRDSADDTDPDGKKDPASETPAQPTPSEVPVPKDKDVKEEEEEKAKDKKAEVPPPPPLETEDPEELKACLADLKALGTKFETQAKITEDEPGCGIEQPIAVAEILPGVDTGGAVMRCETAQALAKWVKNNVQPAMTIAMPGRRVTGIVTGSTYACRLRNNASSGKVSEHARGNAIDVAAFTLDNGETLAMSPRQEDSTLEGAFQRTATASACLYFSTVLAPGSDAAHEDHLHLDVLERRNGYRYCR